MQKFVQILNKFVKMAFGTGKAICHWGVQMASDFIGAIRRGQA
jgi:hypothetical protein